MAKEKFAKAVVDLNDDEEEKKKKAQADANAAIETARKIANAAAAGAALAKARALTGALASGSATKKQVNTAVTPVPVTGGMTAMPNNLPGTGAVVPIGTARPGANSNLTLLSNGNNGQSAMAAANSDYGLYSKLVQDYLKQGTMFAQQGPVSRQQIADSLLGFDIGDYEAGDISNLSMEILSQLGLRNAYFIQQHQLQGTFDDPQFLTGQYISLPSDSYLADQYPLIGAALEESRKKDDEAKLYESNLQSTRGAWEQLEAEKNNPYTFDPMYGYAMMEYLQGDRAEPFNYDQWDYEYQSLTPEQQKERLAELETAWNGLDFDTLTGRNYTPYQSQTAALEAQYDLISKEQERRGKKSEQDEMLRNHPNYGQEYVAPENERVFMPSVDHSGAWTYGYYDSNMYDTQYLINSGMNYSDLYMAAQTNQKVKWFLEEGLNYMTPEEIKEYNVAKSISEEEAETYLKNHRSDFLLRRALVMEEWTKTKAENPWLAVPSYIDARINNLVNVLNVPRQTVEAWLGIDDPNSPAFDALNKSGWVGEAQLEQIQNADIWEPLKGAMSYVYQGATSAVDNFTRLAASGFNPTASMIIAGLQSYSGSLHESSERDDVSGAAKIIKAIGTGAIEVGTEKIGLDALFDKGQAGALQYMKKVLLSELGEEELNALSQPALEAVVAFLFDHEAEIKSGPEFWQELKDTAITTAISSLLMGGGGAISQTIDNRATGKAIMNEGDAQRLLEIAKSMDTNSDVYQIATEIEATTGKGKKMSLGKLGKLTKSLGETLGKQYADITDGVMDKAIQNRLVELGSTPEAAKQNASIIRKIVNGVKLTVTERASAKWDQFAEQVTKEISRQMNATQQNNAAVPGAAAPEGQRTEQKWVKEMHAAQIEATGEVKSKQIRLYNALTTKQSVSTTVQEAVKNSAGKVRKGKSGKAAGKVNATKVYYDDGTVRGEGDIQRFEESEDGKLLMVIEGKDGEAKVDIGSFTQADGEGTAGLLESIKDINDNLHKVSAEEASAMLSSYKAAGGDVARFVESYETLYLRGYSGGTDLAESLPKTDLDGTLANIAVEAGKRQAEADETARKQRASAYKAVEAPTSGWLGKVTSDAQVRGSGDAESLTGALDAMTESQRMTAETAIELGKAIGVNVVLYESDSKNMGRIANGSFDQSTHTVYLDINAGLGSAQDIQAQKDNGTLGYAIMRTMGHELTHYLEAASPEMYAKYKTAVTNALKDAGQDMAVLIREKIDRALSQGKKLSYNGAVAEVIADASEYMLQDSKFTTRLDTTLRGKVKTFVQNFMGKVKEIFSKLTSAHKESEALREMVDGVYRYTGQLQELWDASLQEVMDKGTADPSGDTTEMVEGQNVKYSPRDMANEDVAEMTLEDGKNNLKYVKQLFVKNDRSENHMYIPIAGSLNKGFLELVKQPDLPVVMQVAKGMQAMAPEMARINGGHGHNLTPAEIMSAIGQLNGETAAFYNDKKSRWAAVSESNTGKTIILFFDFGQHINPEYLYGIKTTGDHVLVTAFTREDADNAYDYLGKGGYTKTPDAEVAGARISPSHANRVPDNSVPQPGENVNPDVQNSLRDLPTDITVREFISEAGDDAASTVQEKNALQIYRGKLDDYRKATNEVEAAETALKAVRTMAQDAERDTTTATKGAVKKEWIPKIDQAERRVATARVKQRQAYNKLVAIEETPHMQSVFGWARQFITESLSGTPEEIEARKAETDKLLAEMEAQYEDMKAAGRTQAASESKRRSELYRRMAKAFRSDAAETVKATKAAYREREQKAREYRKTRDEVDKLRRRISRKVKRLNTLRMRETDQKHVPQELQHVADLVMQTFTDSELGRLAFHEAKLLNLGRSYRLLLQSESDATHYWDDEMEADITNLLALGEAYTAMQERGSEYPSRVSLEGVELETEILQGVDAIVSNVLNMIDSTNTAFLYKRNETFEQFANKTGEKLLGHKDHKVRKGIPGKIQEMLDETLRTGNMTPIYFFEHLQNQELLDVFNELRDGQNLYAQIVAEGKDFVQTAKNRYNYGAWVNDGKLKMKTGQGHTIELTREEAAEIYAIAKREQANKLYQTEHLLYGGFQYKNIQDKVSEDGKTQLKNNPHQLDKADIARIGEWLTAEQKAYADELVGFLSTTMADYGNQASMDMYGYKKFTESYYIPFHTVAEQRFLKGDEGPQGENAGTGRVKNSGFTHKVQHKANQTLLVGGLTDTVADHIHKMAAYAAMVQPIENMKRLLNHKVLENDGTSNTIRALIGQKYGKASQDYLTQLLKDANGATQSDQRAAALTDKLVGAFKRGAVMASASVVLQQPTAMARAMAMVSPKYFAQNPFYRPGKGTWDEMMKYSGTAVIKDMGKFDVGMGLTATQYISDENLNVFEAYRRLKGESKTKAGKAAYDRFMAWLTAAPGKADQWTWGLIWKAVKAEQAALHPEMNQQSEAFLNLCGARFDDVIDHTQVYDSVLTRSNLMRSTNALHKMATSFMSEPTLSLNMLYDALTGKHTGKERAGIIGGVVASQVLAGALAALVQAWNDDDDERNWLEKYADRATGNILDNLNPLGMIPYVSDIVSLFQGYDVERPDMSVIADIYDYSKTFLKAFEDGGTPSWKQIENFAGTLANLVGVPAKNISREIRRTRNAIFNTDWSAPDAFGVGQAVLGNVAGYGVNNKDYYKRIVTALARGDTELAKDYKTYMLASKAVDENKLTQGVREAYKEAYERGGIDKDTAIDFLMDNNLVTGDTEDKRKQSAFQYVDKWEEGTTNYSAYNTLKEAYKDISFSEIEKAWKELTNNGYTDKQVKDQSRTLLKKLVQDGNLTTGQATQLLKKWCPYAKDSDNTDKPKEWASEK